MIILKHLREKQSNEYGCLIANQKLAKNLKHPNVLYHMKKE